MESVVLIKSVVGAHNENRIVKVNKQLCTAAVNG